MMSPAIAPIIFAPLKKPSAVHLRVCRVRIRCLTYALAVASGVTIKTIECATPAQESQQIQQQAKDQVNAAIQAASKPED
jgi:hypothetical protein